MILSEDARGLWLFLHRDGGAWTADDLAPELKMHRDAVFTRLDGMSRRNLVEKMPPAAGSRRLRFAVTGSCMVPSGLRLAEVQA